jgi:hypothetical protein
MTSFALQMPPSITPLRFRPPISTFSAKNVNSHSSDTVFHARSHRLLA